MASAAYIARESYFDQREHRTHDYRPTPIQHAANHDAGRKYGDRLGAVAVGMAGPVKAPDWAFGAENSEKAWNLAEAAEKRKDAQIAERHIAALPKELTLEQNVWLVKDYIRQFTRDDRLVQWAIHAPEHGGDNFHVHLLISTRGLDENGFKSHKAKEQQERYKNQSAYVENIRAGWEKISNHHLQRHGFKPTLNRLSHKRAGRDQEPMVHVGPVVADKAQREEWNRGVAERNAERLAQRAERERQSLDQAVEQRHEPATEARTQTAAEPPAPETPEQHHEARLREREERERLERDSRVDLVPSGWRRAEVEDVARELAPDYREAVAAVAALTTEKAKARYALEQKVTDVDVFGERIKERREQLGGVRRWLHDRGWWPDQDLENCERSLRRAEYGREKLGVRVKAVADRLDSAAFVADEALARIRPEAARVLEERRRIAEPAREQLDRLRDAERMAQRLEQRQGQRLRM